MKEETGKQSRTDSDNLKPFEDLDDLTNFARQYFSREFPNPERKGCPSPEKLESIAGSAKIPNKRLQGHLFSCSECFNEYTKAMNVRATAHEKASGWSLRWSIVAASVVSLILAAI